MSVNKERPHLLVIPEDDANRQLIEGFRNHLSIDPRKIHVENVAGGWIKALELFRDSHVSLLRKYGQRQVLILIDFDDKKRLEKAKEYISDEVRKRVFILGSSSDPEELASTLKMSKENVGLALAEACVSASDDLWQSQLLSHNQDELARMKESICENLMIS
jgi:uncharacterized protein YcgL (UPF0745 family)